jgi:hypothetical protein
MRVPRRGIDGPPYIRVGRAIRYLRADLDRWLAAHRVVFDKASVAESTGE